MTIYYVASWGNDSDPGSWEQPFLTLAKAFAVISAGDTIQIGMGGDALILPTADLIHDVEIIGNGRGDDSTIRLQGNIFRVVDATLSLRRVILSDEAAAAHPGIVVAGGNLETYRASFRMTANTAIQCTDGHLSLDQSTIAWSGYPSFASFPAITAAVGSVTMRNSIIAGFSIGLQRVSSVDISLEANDWWCEVPVAVGPMGDYDLIADPLILNVDADVSATPGVNLSLSPSSPCVNRGADLNETDYSGTAPDLGACETVFELPVLYCSFYNILFFLWVISNGAGEVKDQLLQTQLNRSLSTCDSPTMRDKYGMMAGVFRPYIFTSDQFRNFLQVLYEQYTLLPAQSAFDHIINSLFGAEVPVGENDCYEWDYCDQRLWNLDVNISVKAPPSLAMRWDEFWFYRARRWWRSAPTNADTGFVVMDNVTTWIYSDGTVDDDDPDSPTYGCVVWQPHGVSLPDDMPFAIPSDAYIQAVAVADSGAIVDIRHCGYLGVDSYANALSVIFNACEVVINANHSIFDVTDEKVRLLRTILSRIISAHHLLYIRFKPDVFSWAINYAGPPPVPPGPPPPPPSPVFTWSLTDGDMTAYLADGSALPAPIVTRNEVKYLQTSLYGGQVVAANTGRPADIFNNRQVSGLAIGGAVTNLFGQGSDLSKAPWLYDFIEPAISGKIYTDPFGIDNEAQLIFTDDPHIGPYYYQIYHGNLGGKTLQLSMWHKGGPGSSSMDHFDVIILQYDVDDHLLSPLTYTAMANVFPNWLWGYVGHTFPELPNAAYAKIGIGFNSTDLPYGAYVRLPYMTIDDPRPQTPAEITRPADIVTLDHGQSLRGDRGALEFDFIPLHQPHDNIDHWYVTITPIKGSGGYIRFWHEGATNQLVLTINDGATTSTIRSLWASSLNIFSVSRIRIVWKLGTCLIYLNGVIIGSGTCTAVGTHPIPAASRIVLGDGTVEGWFIAKEFDAGISPKPIR